MRSTRPRSVLSPENLGLIEAIVRQGSMAAASRELGMVPSALTYRVRQIEDALDVLLFDRSARQARLTPAGDELLRAGRYLLEELDAVTQRVRRVATGWEPELTIAVDATISRPILLELCEAFYAEQAPTRLKLRSETLSGTAEALRDGVADLALGVTGDAMPSAPDIHTGVLGSVDFVFAIAPHHPLATIDRPLTDDDRRQHRAVAVADSTQRGSGLTHNLSPGQDVLTVPSMSFKLDAQLRGLGVGFLPRPLAQPFILAGRLVVKPVQGAARVMQLHYAWREHRGAQGQGRALRWWLDRLQHDGTRHALLHQHHQT